MGLTLSQTGDWTGVEGNRNTRVFTITFDSSYPTGGESLTAADMALTTIDVGGVQIHSKGGYVFEYDYTNELVIAYNSAALDGAAASAAPLDEVLNTTDISGIGAVTVHAKGW